jgi:hypothetical protein
MFGMYGKVHTCKVSKIHHTYRFDAIESDELAAHVYAVEHALKSGMVSGISRTGGNVFIVHYRDTYACSSVTLSTLEDFVLYEDGPHHKFKDDDEKRCSINVASFRYDNDKLLQMSPHDPVLQAVVTQKQAHVGIYKWESDSRHCIPWSEEVWVTRLFHSLKATQCDVFKGIQIVDAFNWKSSTWESSLLSVFTNIPRNFRVTPFHGMTDVLLIGDKGIGQLNHRTTEPSAVCTSLTTDSEPLAFALEIGLGQAVPYEIAFAQKGKRLSVPEKAGELLASMYQFSSLNYINNRWSEPIDSVSWTGYGILALRGFGTTAFQMTLNESGCHVTVLWQTCDFATLGQEIEMITKKIH